MMTDDERTACLKVRATAALRKSQPRTYQMSWEQIVYGGGIESSSELLYQATATPAFILRLIRRAERSR